MYIKSNILGNTEAFEEASDVLVWRLPWKTPRSDHRLTVHRLRLTAEEAEKQKIIHDSLIKSIPADVYSF